MNSYTQELRNTVQALMTEGKGIVVMDESNGICNRRVDTIGIPATEENRRAYREIF